MAKKKTVLKKLKGHKTIWHPESGLVFRSKNDRVVIGTYDSENDSIKITVSDNGKGIDDSVEHLIFEPKFTTKSSGMGLGLPMIKKIIEAYGGTIDFTSVKDEGTVFTVILPKK